MSDQILTSTPNSSNRFAARVGARTNLRTREFVPSLLLSLRIGCDGGGGSGSPTDTNAPPGGTSRNLRDTCVQTASTISAAMTRD